MPRRSLSDGSDYRGAGIKSALRLTGHFDKLSFDIPAGQWISLLGASGAGKTSLLRIIAGLAAPTHGQVQASDGRPLALVWHGWGKRTCSIRG